MIKSTPTIYDVAARAGVSISTASRVLNDPNKVSEKTRATVLEVIEQLGFVPKADARARALSKSRRVDVVTPFFTVPSFVQRLRGIAEILAPLNYELVIHTVESVSRLNNHLTTLPMRSDLDGLIIIALNIDEANAARLLRGRLETVLIECRHEELSSIEIDDVAGGRMVADYLAAKGHRRFAFIGDSFFPDYGVHPISNRLIGFRQALIEKGIDLPDERVHLVPVDVETTRASTSIAGLKCQNRPRQFLRPPICRLLASFRRRVIAACACRMIWPWSASMIWISQNTWA